MRHTILVVDDDPFILNTLQKRFETWSTQVLGARTPEEAITSMQKFSPDIVLLDVLLNKNDGAGEVVDYMKSQVAFKNTPILILTNLDKPELKEKMLGKGVAEYLIKGSMSLDELTDKVLMYLEPEKQN